ncbi:hypothetical protein DOTSEDRAFT_22239 [Dothistroma septosporum NZE10]|uniref:Uncharacterized protein n=1 Tax=Dothistroma septosporum (strain NZE10 / CBS 128990) TaxID=675120 RepID=N1PT65_DOTSN|nr:hypothetical protein DOTSEDRAFT_22239 [Dothistroma septosporum NZE10]
MAQDGTAWSRWMTHMSTVYAEAPPLRRRKRLIQNISADWKKSGRNKATVTAALDLVHVSIARATTLDRNLLEAAWTIPQEELQTYRAHIVGLDTAIEALGALMHLQYRLGRAVWPARSLYWAGALRNTWLEHRETVQARLRELRPSDAPVGLIGTSAQLDQTGGSTTYSSYGADTGRIVVGKRRLEWWLALRQRRRGSCQSLGPSGPPGSSSRTDGSQEQMAQRDRLDICDSLGRRCLRHGNPHPE